MNIYLDIDGVILANDKQTALHVYDFLKYVTDKYPTYWLSTQCKGNASETIAYLKRCMDEKTLELAKKVKPTNWSYSKTEAIDFKADFLWFDDFLFDDEKETLIKNNALKNWIEVDLSKNMNQLRDFVNDSKLFRR